MSASGKLMPAARMLTSTSPGPGSGAGISATSSASSEPSVRQSTARIKPLPPRESGLAPLAEGAFAFFVILGQPGVGLQVDFRLDHGLEPTRERRLHELESQRRRLAVLQRKLARARQRSPWCAQLIDQPDALGMHRVDDLCKRDDLLGAS